MNDKILVTYSSRTGWTVGVAEAIGKMLAENGVQADVIPMKDVKDLSIYDAVVAGSAIRNKRQSHPILAVGPPRRSRPASVPAAESPQGYADTTSQTRTF